MAKAGQPGGATRRRGGMNCRKWPAMLIFKQKVLVRGQGVYEIEYKNLMPGMNPINFPLINYQRRSKQL